MTLVPSELFVADAADFGAMLQTSAPVDLFQPVPFRLELRTLAATQYFLDDLLATTTVEELTMLAADLIKAPPFCVKLLFEDQMLDSKAKTLADVGLDKPDTCVTLVRHPATRTEWTQLFGKLLSAIEGRRAEEAKALVDQGAGLDGEGNILKAGSYMRLPGDRTVDENEPGNTMLHLAIRQGLADLALYLISRNVDVDACSDLGRTPLMMAILKRQHKVIDTLLHAKANVSVRDYMGHSALAYALKAGDDEVAAQIVALGGLETSEPYRGEHATPATISCNPFAGLAPASATSRPNTDAVVLRGDFPVLSCCASGLPLTAIALLRQGIKPQGSDDCGRTALHYAHDLDEDSHGSHRATLLDALRENGADADAADKFGNLPEWGVCSPQEPDAAPTKCTARIPIWNWMLSVM